MPALCRDCLAHEASEDHVRDDHGRCRACGSARTLAHPELFSLAIAHVDCDAFYAAIEVRDRPELAGKPLLIGYAGPDGKGGRGVVATASYEAREFGCRSAMPMAKALKLCPHAVVLRPDIAKYARVSEAVREIFLSLTPLVEPLSLDEAYLDLAGTESVHRRPPAVVLAEAALRVEREVRISFSIGLSHAMFLAKIASDLDKPRGFAVIGREETERFLAGRPVRILPGIGPRTAERLAAAGFRTVGDLARVSASELVRRFGAVGEDLALRCRGQDPRRVVPEHDAKSVSAETTFDVDLSAFGDLKHALWPLCEKVSRRLKNEQVAGPTVVLKLKTSRFVLHTRRTQLAAPTQLAETIWQAGVVLLKKEARGEKFRLIGIGITDLCPPDLADPVDLADPQAARRSAAERAIDAIRAKFGDRAITKGR
jgi:DNA polymerase-4